MPSPSLLDAASRISPMAEKRNKKWIRSAVPASHEGKFSAKAKAAGMSTAAYAEKEKHAPGTLGREARLAQTFEGMHHGGAKKKSKMYAKSEGRMG
jgi:hypothetical protein